jgi:hypothetical protein
MRHRFGKGVIGLVAGLAAICLLSLPASANTATIQFTHSTTGTPGTIDVYNADEEIVTSVPVGSTTTPTCSTGATGISVTTNGTLTTTSGGGTISIVFTNNCSAFTTGTGTGATRWCSSMNGTFTGTWTHVTGSAKTYTSNAATLTVVLQKDAATAPTHNCHSLLPGTCTIVVGPITVSGLITSTTIPTLAVSDTATVAGGANLGDLTVVGTAANCGLFIGANNGFATINAHVHVTAV